VHRDRGCKWLSSRPGLHRTGRAIAAAVCRLADAGQAADEPGGLVPGFTQLPGRPMCPGSSSSDRSPDYETSGVTSTRARIGSFAVSIS
jgi:hypothetical protein